jgi:hypothetical protein
LSRRAVAAALLAHLSSLSAFLLVLSGPRPVAATADLSTLTGVLSGLATIHSVAESGGLSDERCFPPVRRSASQCSRPINDDKLTASFCNRDLRFRSVTVPSPQTGLRSSPEGQTVRINLQLTSATSEPLISLSSRAVANLPFVRRAADVGRSSSSSSYCAQLSSWASPMRSPSGPRM